MTRSSEQSTTHIRRSFVVPSKDTLICRLKISVYMPILIIMYE